VAKKPIIARDDIERRYPDVLVSDEFVPTHRVRVMAPHEPKKILQEDFVWLDPTPSSKGVCMAYGPDPEEPLYAATPSGLWQSFDRHGRVVAVEVRYEAHYIPQKDRLGNVYFVQAGAGGPIKIGWTQDIDRRIAELQTANAHKLSLLGMIPGTMEREAALHAQFDHLRLEAEWFQNSPEIFDFIRERAVKPL